MTILVIRVVPGAEAVSFGAQGKLMATGQMVEQGDESGDQIKCGFDDWSFSAAGFGHGDCEKKEIAAPVEPTAKGRNKARAKGLRAQGWKNKVLRADNTYGTDVEVGIGGDVTVA